MTDVIIITKDGKPFLELDNPWDAQTELRTWYMRTPFWQPSSLQLFIYKDIENNEDYIHRNDPLPDSGEKNLFFTDTDNNYVCLRCRRPSEIMGFCNNCYLEIYGLKNKEIVEVSFEIIKCSEKFFKVIDEDKIYTESIKQSIIKDGLKNPLIIDSDNILLIGHHRYYIIKDLGWKTVPVIYNNIKFNHGLFYEGKGYSIFVLKIDGELNGSSTNLDDFFYMIPEFKNKSMGNTFHLECYINAGTDIRLRNVFIPERGDVVDPTWYDWYVRKFNKKPKIGKNS